MTNTGLFLFYPTAQRGGLHVHLHPRRQDLDPHGVHEGRVPYGRAGPRRDVASLQSLFFIHT